MHVIWWILSILAAVIGVVGIAFSASSLFYIRKFARNSHVTIATVVSQAEVKRKKGTLPVVQFRTPKKKVTAKATAFDKNTTITMGQKVSIRYLADDRLPPDKWDIRIVGKNGYGKKLTTRVAVIVLAAAVVILAAAITVMVVFG